MVLTGGCVLHACTDGPTSPKDAAATGTGTRAARLERTDFRFACAASRRGTRGPHKYRYARVYLQVPDSLADGVTGTVVYRAVIKRAGGEPDGAINCRLPNSQAAIAWFTTVLGGIGTVTKDHGSAGVGSVSRSVQPSPTGAQVAVVGGVRAYSSSSCPVSPTTSCSLPIVIVTANGPYIGGWWEGYGTCGGLSCSDASQPDYGGGGGYDPGPPPDTPPPPPELDSDDFAGIPDCSTKEKVAALQRYVQTYCAGKQPTATQRERIDSALARMERISPACAELAARGRYLLGQGDLRVFDQAMFDAYQIGGAGVSDWVTQGNWWVDNYYDDAHAADTEVLVDGYTVRRTLQHSLAHELDHSLHGPTHRSTWVLTMNPYAGPLPVFSVETVIDRSNTPLSMECSGRGFENGWP